MWTSPPPRRGMTMPGTGSVVMALQSSCLATYSNSLVRRPCMLHCTQTVTVTYAHTGSSHVLGKTGKGRKKENYTLCPLPSCQHYAMTCLSFLVLVLLLLYILCILGILSTHTRMALYIFAFCACGSLALHCTATHTWLGTSQVVGTVETGWKVMASVWRV